MRQFLDKTWEAMQLIGGWFYMAGIVILATLLTFWPYVYGMVLMAHSEKWLMFVLSLSFPPIAWIYGVWEIVT